MKKLLKVICLSLLLFSFTSLACAQDEIRIGVLFPLTGLWPARDRDCWKGQNWQRTSSIQKII